MSICLCTVGRHNLSTDNLESVARQLSDIFDINTSRRIIISEIDGICQFRAPFLQLEQENNCAMSPCYRRILSIIIALMVASPLSAQIPIRTIRAEKEGDSPHYNGEDLYFICDNLLKSAFFYKGESIMLIPRSPSKQQQGLHYSNFYAFDLNPETSPFSDMSLSLLEPYRKEFVQHEIVEKIDGTSDYIKEGFATPGKAVEGVPFEIVDISFTTGQYGLHSYRLLLKDRDGRLVLFANGLEKTRDPGSEDTYTVRTSVDPYWDEISRDDIIATVEHHPATFAHHRSRPFFMAKPIEKAMTMVGKSYRVKPDGKYGFGGRTLRRMDGGKYYPASGTYTCTEVCFMPVGWDSEMVPCMILTDKDGTEYFGKIGVTYEPTPFDQLVDGAPVKGYFNLVILHELVPVR